MTSKQLTACALFYEENNTPSLLAGRLLSSWSRSLQTQCLGSGLVAANMARVKDFRLGINGVSSATESLIRTWAEDTWSTYGIQVILYKPLSTARKYPVMRRMLYDDQCPPAKYFLWCDDDTYLDPVYPDWWQKCIEAVDRCDGQIGHVWMWRLNHQQLAWVKTRPWYGPRGIETFKVKFTNGAFWAMKTETLRRLNWPDPALNHNGGDVMLGVCLSSHGIPIVNFEYGVRVNADDQGRHSKAARRGYSEQPIGWRYSSGDPPMSLDHHAFEVERTIVGGE